MPVPPLLCVTGLEPSLDALARRLDGVAADLHEVRLDALCGPSDDVAGLLARHAPRVVATCRRAADGGRAEGAEAERLAQLARAAAAGVAWLDVEADAIASLGPPPPGVRVLASLHDPAGTLGPAAAAARLREVPADGAKLATWVDDAAGLLALRSAALPHAVRIQVGLGPGGLWTRVRPGDFASTWTYVSATPDAPPGPGILDLERAARLRVPSSADLRPVAVLGGAQVVSSRGVDHYNPVYARLGLPLQYVALPAASWADARAACGAFGVAWASVTMPFKRDAARDARVLDAAARLAGAANTVRLEAGRPVEAWNTDVPAALDLLAAAGLPAGAAVRLLGACASADGIGRALAAAGARVTASARDPERARAGGWPEALALVPWADRADGSPDAVVNCTPLGADGASDPWPADAPLRVPIVMDLANPRDRDTPLAGRARAAGCAVVTGHRFWQEQGRRQLAIIAAGNGMPLAPGP